MQSTLQPTPLPARPRYLAIDYMKGVLTIGMILAHALQLLSQPRGLFWWFSTLVNLLSFSGFLFCFGYVFYQAYLTKFSYQVQKKMGITALKTLLAYYLSGMASFLFLPGQLTNGTGQLSLTDVAYLLSLSRVAWVSEFLLSFCFITLLVGLFFRQFVALCNSPGWMLGTGIFCLVVAACLPADFVIGRPLSLLLGTPAETTFPLLMYLPVFLAGLYCSKYRVVWKPTIGLFAGLGSCLFLGYYAWHRSVPAEFRPSFYWLVGSYGIVYGYFLAAHWLERRLPAVNWLLTIGRNTLAYLLLSNFMLFSLHSRLQTSPVSAVLIGISVLLIVEFLLNLTNKPVTPGTLSNAGITSPEGFSRPV